VNWLLALLSVGALCRLTRLVTGDQITEPLRDRVEARWQRQVRRGKWWAEHFDYGYLITCPWCASIWLAPLAAVPVWFPTNRLVWAAALGLTASLIAGQTQAREPESEDPSA
jgi:hypothetical protein